MLDSEAHTDDSPSDPYDPQLREKDRIARDRDTQARKDAEERNKILSGKLAYLINKSAIDDENQASARQDVKRLELQLQQNLAEKVALDRENRSAKEANRVLAEAMQIKQKELEQMEIQSQIRAAGDEDELEQKDEADGGFSSSSNAHKRHGAYRIHTQPQRGREALAYGIKVRKTAPKFAATVLDRVQINGFLRYAARQPESKHLQCCADKFVQMMNIMCEDAESEDQVCLCSLLASSLWREDASKESLSDSDRPLPSPPRPPPHNTAENKTKHGHPRPPTVRTRPVETQVLVPAGPSLLRGRA